MSADRLDRRRACRSTCTGLALAFACLLVGPAPSAQAAFPGTNGKIAYTSYESGVGCCNGDIYVIKQDGSGRTNITNTPTENELALAWSPDGAELGFNSGPFGGIMNGGIMNADGSGRRSFPEGIGPVSWSPDGEKVLYIVFNAATENGDIYVKDLSSGESKQLTSDPANEGGAQWSPDGSKIVFGRALPTPSGNPQNELFVMNPDGSGQTNLTNNAANDQSADWSPDGQKIAFFSSRSPAGIYVMNPDGTGVNRLASGNNPAWSPDGQKMAFALLAGNWDIYLMNANGTGATPLDAGASDQLSPDWQPIPHQSTPAPPFDHPRLASPLRISLVPVHRPTLSQSQCSARGGTPSTHGAPLSFTSCNPPAYRPGTVARLGPASEGTASVGAIYGDTNPANGDHANLTLRASLSDVQTQAGTDYAPNPSGADATLVAAFRLTDTYNGPSQNDPGTTRNFDFDVPLDCAPTAGPEGSSCEVDTSADALSPGAIRENESMVMQVLRLRVDDSGLNGTRGDPDDRIFATHGLYVP